MDVVWFAEIKWDYLRTRKQQIIRRKPDDVRILFLEPYVKGRPNRFGLRREGNVLCATVPFVKAVPGAFARGLLDRRRVRDAVDKVALSRVRRLIGAAGFTRGAAVRIISNVYAIHVATAVPGPLLLYDCNDAHGAFPGMPPWTEDYAWNTCRRANYVFATSQALLDDATAIRGGEGSCELLGNGVEFGHFKKTLDERGFPEPQSPPRLGYLGAIAPWFDFDLVETLAKAHPEWNVDLVGPVMLGAEADVDRLTRLDNVRLRPPVAYDDVPRVLLEFSVGLIPFRYNALTRGVNPNKMYEYLAVGLPVVASRFSAEVQKYPELVATAADGAEFVAACEAFAAIAGDATRLAGLRQEAVRIASRHDWRVIAASFWNRVKSLAGK